MTSGRRPLDDAGLDALLLAAQPTFPRTPDLASAVHARLAEAGARHRTPLRWAAILAVVVLLVAAGVVVAGTLGVGPLRILFGQALPTPSVPDTPLGIRLALGQRLTLGELRDRSDLPLLVPAALGAPDECHRLSNGIVSFVYETGDALPELGASGIGALVMVIPGDLDPSLVEKIVHESDATVEPVSVGVNDGYWISGGPHLLRYVEPDGGGGEVRSRVVGDALVWTERGVVLRIESRLGRDASIALASDLVSLR